VEKPKPQISAEESTRKTLLAFDCDRRHALGQIRRYLGVYGAGAPCRVTMCTPTRNTSMSIAGITKTIKGQLLIQNIVGKARTGGGYLQIPGSEKTGGPELPSLPMPAVW